MRNSFIKKLVAQKAVKMSYMVRVALSFIGKPDRTQKKKKKRSRRQQRALSSLKRK